MKTLILTTLSLISLNVYAGGTDTVFKDISFIDQNDSSNLPIGNAVWNPGKGQIGQIKIKDIIVPVEIAPKNPWDMWMNNGKDNGTTDGGSEDNKFTEGGSEDNKFTEGGSEDNKIIDGWPGIDFDTDINGDGDGGVETKPKVKPVLPQPKLWGAPVKGGTDTVHVPVETASYNPIVTDVTTIKYLGEDMDSVFLKINNANQIIKIKDMDLYKVNGAIGAVSTSVQNGSWVTVK